MIWIILLLALLLRLININQSLWLDEATQAILSSQSYFSIIFERGGDFHPPLSYLLGNIFLMFGKSEAWLRILPVLFGVATIWIVYLIVKKLFTTRIALISALFLSMGPYHVYYSQEFRMYSQVTFFGCLSMYFFYFLNKKTINQVGYILSTAFLLYSHYMGVFLMAAQIFFLLFKRKNQIKLFMTNLSVVLILYLPWIPQFLSQLGSGIKAEEYLPGWSNLLSLSFYKAIPLTFIKFSLGRIDFDNIFFYGLVSALILSFCSLLIFKALKNFKDEKVIFLIFWLFIPIILAWIISLKIPIYQPFRLLFVLPAFYILLALGIDSFAKYKNFLISLVLMISLGGLLVYYTNPRFWREDWRGAVKFVNNNLKEDTAVVFAWPEAFPPYNWYGGKNGVGVVKKFPAKQDDVDKNMSTIKTKEEVFYFEYLQDLSDPKKNVKNWFKENGFIIQKTYDFSSVGFIEHYLKVQ